MIFESLNNNVMLVELSDDEMKTYNITYESLNNQDADTQIAIRKLLDHIDNKNSIKTSGKVVVEALPIDGGGCFFIFTFMQDRRKYKLKRAEPNSFFALEKLDDLLDLISTLQKTTNNNLHITAYEMERNYFVSIPRENAKVKVVLEEFGRSIDKITKDRVLEYGKIIGKIYLQ